ncbi:hypothetical protein [Aeromicrobium panaciterrae]|uniref:hypothetical protein n=1 Tax=Aeromicrobium panaciterrae TaxID=363861 RepID=UPI0031DEEB81
MFIAVMTLSTLYMMYTPIVDRLDKSEANQSKTVAALDKANAKVAALGSQVRRLGEEPVVSVKPVPAPAPVRGATGPAGPAGQNATDSQVAAAIATYCISHGGCRGPVGPAGAAGAAGTNGTNGADGKDGADGADGKDGRGIASVTCQGLGTLTLTITYSDGTSEQVPCGA